MMGIKLVCGFFDVLFVFGEFVVMCYVYVIDVSFGFFVDYLFC